MTDQVEALQQIIEHMATEHVVFRGPKGEALHPDWCPLCRLEKAEAIGSPSAIADWIETAVVPMLGVRMGLPEVSVAKGAVHQGCTAGDLIAAVRDAEVLLGD